MPIVTYLGRAAHREMRIGLRDLVFFPKIPMKVSKDEADEIARLVKAGENYSIEYSPSESVDIEPEPLEKPKRGKKAKAQVEESVKDPFDFTEVDESDEDDIEDLM